MSADKDHLTEQLRQREKAQEDRFFEEQSKKQIEKLRQARAAAAATVSVDCPRCGAALEEKHQRGIALDACPKGHGVWLDAVELEQVTKREGEGWLARLLLGST